MKPASPLKRWLSIAALCAAAMATPASATPVLLGSASLNLANDLTVIQDGNQVLQFLDLTSSQGMTITNAVSTFGASGFHWANGAEVAQLFAAFGITYQSVFNGVAFLDVPTVQAAAYLSYLGKTDGDAAFGWIDENTVGSFRTWSCISLDVCRNGSFVANSDLVGDQEPRVGFFLMRSTVVPEPGTAALIGIGLAGILALRRREGKE